jgi:hypothetical protein
MYARLAAGMVGMEATVGMGIAACFWDGWCIRLGAACLDNSNCGIDRYIRIHG